MTLIISCNQKINVSRTHTIVMHLLFAGAIEPYKHSAYNISENSTSSFTNLNTAWPGLTSQCLMKNQQHECLLVWLYQQSEMHKNYLVSCHENCMSHLCKLSLCATAKVVGRAYIYSQAVADYILSFLSANIELELMTMKLTI